MRIIRERGLRCLKGLIGLVPVPWLVLLEAIPAVNRPTLGRLERNLGLSSAIGAGRVVHLSRFAAVAALPLVSVHYYYLQPQEFLRTLSAMMPRLF